MVGETMATFSGRGGQSMSRAQMRRSGAAPTGGLVVGGREHDLPVRQILGASASDQQPVGAASSHRAGSVGRGKRLHPQRQQGGAMLSRMRAAETAEETARRLRTRPGSPPAAGVDNTSIANGGGGEAATATAASGSAGAEHGPLLAELLNGLNQLRGELLAERSSRQALELQLGEALERAERLSRQVEAEREARGALGGRVEQLQAQMGERMDRVEPALKRAQETTRAVHSEVLSQVQDMGAMMDELSDAAVRADSARVQMARDAEEEAARRQTWEAALHDKLEQFEKRLPSVHSASWQQSLTATVAATAESNDGVGRLGGAAQSLDGLPAAAYPASETTVPQGVAGRPPEAAHVRRQQPSSFPQTASLPPPPFPRATAAAREQQPTSLHWRGEQQHYASASQQSWRDDVPVTSPSPSSYTGESDLSATESVTESMASQDDRRSRVAYGGRHGTHGIIDQLPDLMHVCLGHRSDELFRLPVAVCRFLWNALAERNLSARA